MHDKIKQKITTYRNDVALCISLDEEFWNLLDQHAPNMITRAIKERIKTERCNYDRVTTLLEYLERRPDSDFVNFCKALVMANLEYVVQDYFKDALLFAGTSLDDINKELNKQSVSSQHPQPVVHTKEVLVLNVTDSAYKVDVTKSTKEFYNDKKERAYSVEPKSQGYAIIINVKHVPGHDAREGTDIDRNKIEDLLKALGFENIATYDDKNGLDAEEIMQKVKGFVTSVSKKAKRVALFFLSHGGPGTISGTDGGKVLIDDLMQCLSRENAPGLAGIPKLMVFQACRGKKREVAPDALLVEDLVVCFPSQEGYTAWRNKRTGSWFIAALVQVFEKHAHCENIIELMKKVEQQVHERTKETGDRTKYQTPDIQRNLTKDLYFFPGQPEFE